MAYRNKTYVCFDADSDIKYYNLMKAWKENDSIAFDFHNAHVMNNLQDVSSEEQIKKKLIERLHNTKVLIILIGKSTKNLFKYVRWEINYAIENKIPIIAVNLNMSTEQDVLCPPCLKNELAIYIPFGQKIINYTLNNWPESHTKKLANNDLGSYNYNKSVYDKLGV